MFVACRRKRSAEECAICVEQITSMDEQAGALKTLACNHRFHKGCWAQYGAKPSTSSTVLTCPVCRQAATT